jgi:hypothetical protein
MITRTVIIPPLIAIGRPNAYLLQTVTIGATWAIACFPLTTLAECALRPGREHPMLGLRGGPNSVAAERLEQWVRQRFLPTEVAIACHSGERESPTSISTPGRSRPDEWLRPILDHFQKSCLLTTSMPRALRSCQRGLTRIETRGQP